MLYLQNLIYNLKKLKRQNSNHQSSSDQLNINSSEENNESEGEIEEEESEEELSDDQQIDFHISSMKTHKFTDSEKYSKKYFCFTLIV